MEDLKGVMEVLYIMLFGFMTMHLSKSEELYTKKGKFYCFKAYINLKWW